MKILLKYFKIISLKSLPGKFLFMILGEKTYCKQTLLIDSNFVEASDDVI